MIRRVARLVSSVCFVLAVLLAAVLVRSARVDDRMAWGWVTDDGRVSRTIWVRAAGGILTAQIDKLSYTGDYRPTSEPMPAGMGFHWWDEEPSEGLRWRGAETRRFQQSSALDSKYGPVSYASRMVSFPIWTAVAAAMLPALFRLARAERRWKVLRRQRRRLKRQLCPDCGYDMRATPLQCPECGREAGPLPARTWSWRPGKAAIVRIAVAAIVLTMGGLVVRFEPAPNQVAKWFGLGGDPGTTPTKLGDFGARNVWFNEFVRPARVESSATLSRARAGRYITFPITLGPTTPEIVPLEVQGLKLRFNAQVDPDSVKLIFRLDNGPRGSQIWLNAPLAHLLLAVRVDGRLITVKTRDSIWDLYTDGPSQNLGPGEQVELVRAIWLSEFANFLPDANPHTIVLFAAFSPHSLVSRLSDDWEFPWYAIGGTTDDLRSVVRSAPVTLRWTGSKWEVGGSP